jgi:signal transduction histidine kinase
METNRIKVLAIDDNQDNLTSLKALIGEAFPEATVLTALSGTAGFALAAAEDPEVILLDIVMPGMDGFEVCRKLKADTKLCDIPVIFVTALKGDKESRLRALDCGAEAFLAKPIDEIELMAQIRAMVKIKSANLEKRDKISELAALVDGQTRELKKAHGDTLKLLEDLRAENEARKISEEELQKNKAEIEQFMYTVSHDLRSPLVTVKSFMGYLEKDLASGDREQFEQDIVYINSAADKMKLLLDELLEFSRIGRVESPSVKITFKELAADVLDTMAGTIIGNTVAIKLPEAELMLFGDRQRLCQLWQNLVENAVKYSTHDTEPAIELGWRQENGEPVFFVSDNGIGIDPRYHGKIFGIFEKLDPRSPGAGLGLSMVKRIVENNGGRIWVESEGEGQGSCFRFTLPRAVNV